MVNNKLTACLAAAVFVFGGAAMAVNLNRDQQVQSVAATVYDGDLSYSEVTGGVAITAYTGNGGDVEIPSEIGDAKVVAIAENAFYQCDAVKSVTIPNTVKTIGDNAFFYCTAMTSVNIPDSVTDIGVCAFSGCSKLKSVSLPQSVKTVREAAFSDCTALKTVAIPDEAITFKYEAFAGCTALKSVTVPFEVAGIEDGAFGFTISADEKAMYKEVPGFEIDCYTNSAAHSYAEENGLSYNLLDADAPDYNVGVELPDDSESDDIDGEYEVGDVNGDGVVNVADISLAVGVVKGDVPLDAQSMRRADVNKDGRVNITDISLISAHVQGKDSL